MSGVGTNERDGFIGLRLAAAFGINGRHVRMVKNKLQRLFVRKQAQIRNLRLFFDRKIAVFLKLDLIEFVQKPLARLLGVVLIEIRTLRPIYVDFISLKWRPESNQDSSRRPRCYFFRKALRVRGFPPRAASFRPSSRSRTTLGGGSKSARSSTSAPELVIGNISARIMSL